MASESSLADRIASGRYYMNKIFGRGLERVRALERDVRGHNPLGTVKRITIEPKSGGVHRVVVEHESASMPLGRLNAGAERIGSSPVTEHLFHGAEDAMRFLGDVLSNRPPVQPGAGGEAGRFLDQVLEENAGR